MSTYNYPALANFTIPKVNIKNKKFLDTDELYMSKMQSLFGIDYDDEDDQKQDKLIRNRENHADEKSKKRRDKAQHHARKHCTDNKNSIPKSSKSPDADWQKIRSSKQYEEKCAEEERRGHKERRSKSSRTELPEANSKFHTNKETGRDHTHKKSLNGKLSSKSERHGKIVKSNAKKVCANNEIEDNLAKSVDGKRQRRHSLLVSDKVTVNEKAIELNQKDKSEKLEIQMKLTRFVNAITEQSISEKNDEDCIKLKREQDTEKHVFCWAQDTEKHVFCSTDEDNLGDIERTMEEVHSVESSSKVKMPIEDTISSNPCKKTLKEVISEIISSQSTLEEIHSVESSSKVKMPVEETNSQNPLCEKTLKEVISEIISPQSVVDNGSEVSVDTPHTFHSGDTISYEFIMQKNVKEVTSGIISSESLVGKLLGGKC
ncbi:hypothetical protein JTB14_021923 [Gonioctena quinquepunctata]|nr:hypothetical protein JTB14_021923 [Gonioctena quinquepunctata]